MNQLPAEKSLINTGGEDAQPEEEDAPVEDEPTEEEIEEVLSSDAFDFPAIEERPAVFEVQLSRPDEESLPIDHVISLNRHLGAAFFALDRSIS